MGLRRKAFMGATAISAGIAAGGTAHAPKRIDPVFVAVDGALPAQNRGPLLARPPTPWPMPFAAIADDLDEEPLPSARRPVRLPKRPPRPLTAGVRPSSGDQVLAAATPYTLPGPIAVEPDPYTSPPGPPRELPSPVIDGPFGPPLLDPSQATFFPPIVSAEPPTFVLGVDPLTFDPLMLGPPTVGLPAVLLPVGGVVGVPEPAALSAILIATLLLGRPART